MDTEHKHRLLWFLGIWAVSVVVFAVASKLLHYLVFGLMGAAG